jgi:hypothetical protein
MHIPDINSLEILGNYEIKSTAKILRNDHGLVLHPSPDLEHLRDLGGLEPLTILFLSLVAQATFTILTHLMLVLLSLFGSIQQYRSLI